MMAQLARIAGRALVSAVCLIGVAEAARADALDLMKATGTIRLGFRSDAPPFSYRDEAGAPAGLAVSLCEAVAAGIGAGIGLPDLKRAWVPVTSRTRFNAINAQKIDLLCGPTTQTLSRRETMDFSIPYFIDGAGVVFRRGGPESLSELTDEPAGVLAGTTTETLVPRLLRKAGARSQVRSFDSHVEGISALERGEIEAYFGDQSILYYQLGRMRPAVPLVVAPDTLSFEPYALAMNRGETRLRLLVDGALSRIYRTGEIYDHIRRSLGRVHLSKLTQAVYEVVAIPD